MAEEAAPEVVTVKEAAERIGVTIPRLRRLLEKEPWNGHAKQEQREYKTGTRNTTVIPVSILPALNEALQAGTGNRNGVSGGSGTETDIVPLYQRIVSEQEGRIKTLETTNEDLRRERDWLRAMLEQERTRQERALPPPPEPLPQEQQKQERRGFLGWLRLKR